MATEEVHPQRFYRFHKENCYSVHGEFEEVMEYTKAVVKCEEYRLDRVTPKGYWIKALRWSSNGKQKVWISKTGKKRHAYPTRKEALESFLIRARHRKNHLTAQLRQVNDAVAYATENKDKLLQST